MNDATQALLDLAVAIRDNTAAVRENTAARQGGGAAGGGSVRAAGGTGGAGGAVFPNYGRSKGQPVKGATMGDLEFYAAGCRRSLGDPAKSKWHDRERVVLAAIEAEIAAQSGTVPAASYGAGDFGPGDDDIPF